MEKQSHKSIVRDKLEMYGEVNNLWCLQHNIWRLSDVILKLRQEGLNITTEYNTERVGKNTHYKLIKDKQPSLL